MSRRVDDSAPPTFRAYTPPRDPNGPRGWCYAAAEALYHALGGKDAGLTPMQMTHEGVSHWYLRWDTPNGITLYIDPTASQFKTLPEYRLGTGRGFQTKEPSRAAKELMT